MLTDTAGVVCVCVCRLVLTVVVPAEELEALHSREFKALIWSYTSATLNMPLPSVPGAATATAAAEETTTDEAATATAAAVDGDVPSSRGGLSPVTTPRPPPAPESTAAGPAEAQWTDAAAAAAAAAASTIPVLQVNSVRMSRLVEKVDQIVADASYPRMAHFNDYDALAALQLDIAKLKVMYLAKKLRDAIVNDVSLLDTTLANAVSQDALLLAAGATSGHRPPLMRRATTGGGSGGSGGGGSTAAPLRGGGAAFSSSGAAALAALSNHPTGGSGGVGLVYTHSAPLLRRESTGGAAGLNGGGGNASGGSGGSSGSSAQSQWLLQQQQAQWLLQRASPGTLRGMLLPRVVVSAAATAAGVAEKEVRAICVSPTFCAIRWFSLDVDSLVYTLSHADYGLPTAAAVTSPQLQQLYVDAALDRYFLSLSRYSEAALLLVQCVVNQLGFPVVRAVHDIWSRLNPLSVAVEQQSHSGGCKGSGSGSGSGSNVISTRISTPQRGGIWVVGSRLLNRKPMLAVVTNCATFDEVMEVFNLLAHEALVA